MRTIRCHLDAELAPGRELVLPETASNHVIRVLRLDVGETLHLFNGDGHDYQAEILSQEKRGARVRIISRHAIDNESPLRIHLYQCIARGEKMDWILQKATELGVTAFTPVVSERTEVKLDHERADKRLAHWQGVIRAACEQSGRASVPTLHAPLAINRLDPDSVPTQAFHLQPGAAMKVAGLGLDTGMETAVAVGPEGGFSARDIQCLHAAGFRGLSLGPRILRTETAGIALLAALQSAYGDW